MMPSQPPGTGPESAVEASATDLLDLAGVTLGELPAIDDGDVVGSAVARVLKQVEKPRTNLGSSGPPGRTD